MIFFKNRATKIIMKIEDKQKMGIMVEDMEK
jgi:hypothetical protein